MALVVGSSPSSLAACGGPSLRSSTCTVSMFSFLFCDATKTKDMTDRLQEHTTEKGTNKLICRLPVCYIFIYLLAS